MTLLPWPNIVGVMPGDWVDDAVCDTGTAETFFPTSGENQTTVKHAKWICAGCPVRTECLDFAIENNIRDGVWGMATPNEREALRKLRRRAAAH